MYDVGAKQDQLRTIIPSIQELIDGDLVDSIAFVATLKNGQTRHWLALSPHGVFPLIGAMNYIQHMMIHNTAMIPAPQPDKEKKDE